MSRNWCFVPTLVLAFGCADASPRSPTPTTPLVLFGPHTLNGRVVSTQSLQPVAGATVTIRQDGVLEVVTDAQGQYAAVGVPTGRVWIGIRATGHLPRFTSLDVAGSRQNLDLDVIRDEPPFSLDFYRLFARQGLDSPSLHELRTWEDSPRFYVRTVTVDLGEAVDSETLLAAERVIRGTVGELSGNRLSAAEVAYGREDRPREHGWVNVNFVSTRDYLVRNFRPGIAAVASLGGPSGLTYVLYSSETRAANHGFGVCESAVVGLLEHELVHVMGFGHTFYINKDFHTPDCSGAGRSIEARHHAGIVYSRRPGNRDIDSDPDGPTLVATSLYSAPVVLCTRDHLFGTFSR